MVLSSAVRLDSIGVASEVGKSCEEPPEKAWAIESDLMNDRLPIHQNESGRNLNGFGEVK
jgi:hypothetical protein